MTRYTVEIDASLCGGFGTCAELTPDIVLDDFGFAVARNGESDDPAVHEAAARCPMAAIRISERKAA